MFDLIVFLVLLGLGLVWGRFNERRHYRSITKREAQLKDVLVFNERKPPAALGARKTVIAMGAVVIAEDYFKRVMAMLISLVGGRMTVYESLMDRGRREAILRMKAQAAKQGAWMIFDVHVETSSLSEDRTNNAMFSAEFIAYGTALIDK